MQGVFIRGKFGSRTRTNSLPIQQPDTFNIHANNLKFLLYNEPTRQYIYYRQNSRKSPNYNYRRNFVARIYEKVLPIL